MGARLCKDIPHVQLGKEIGLVQEPAVCALSRERTKPECGATAAARATAARGPLGLRPVPAEGRSGRGRGTSQCRCGHSDVPGELDNRERVLGVSALGAAWRRKATAWADAPFALHANRHTT